MERRTYMLLENKNAVIYGGGGAIGGAVARAFAREGAKVFLAGRTLARLDQVAHEMAAAGKQTRRRMLSFAFCIRFQVGQEYNVPWRC